VSVQHWIELVAIVVCFILAGLASGTETALTSVGRLRVRYLADEGSRAARILQKLQRDPNRFLSTVLLVNTVALIVASSSTTLLTDDLFTTAGVPSSQRLWLALLVSLLLSILLLLLAEVTPKTLAIRYAERVALAAAGPVDRMATFLNPVLWAVTIVSRALTGGRAAKAAFLTEEELITLLHVSEEQGVIEEQEHDMIHGIIQIGDKSVREVMVPRTDMVAVDKGSSLQDIVRVFKQHRHTRLPVYKGDLDHIVGLIHAKDLLLFYTLASAPEFDLEKILRPILFTPETKKVDELLHEMRSKKVHMMVVVDEYGGTAGLVSLEDLLEEIVGEIRDEYDQAEEEQFRLISPTEVLVDARYSMDELNSRLGLGINESGEYDSVGGYVVAALGTIPAPGATFQGGRARWKVEQVRGNRVELVRLTSDHPWPDDVLTEAGFTPPKRPSRVEADGFGSGEER
jgi:putative hemolysin